MNFRNLWLVRIIRILTGLFFVFSGASGLMAGMNHMEGVPPEMVASSQVLWDIGIFQAVKTTEIVGGLMLLFGFLPWLGAIFLAPVAVGATVTNAVNSPQYLPAAVIASLLLMYLGYAYWSKYAQLFTRKLDA